MKKLLYLACSTLLLSSMAVSALSLDEMRAQRKNANVADSPVSQVSPKVETERTENIDEIATKLNTTINRITAAEEAVRPVNWHVGSWKGCSTSCGGGVDTRTVYCPKGMESLCIGSKPASTRSCNTQYCSWSVTSWGSCNKTCGGGKQYRTVTCSGKLCNPSTKPSTVQNCNTQTCYGTWYISGYRSCQGDKCGYGTQDAIYACTTAVCPSPKPKSTQSCWRGGCGGASER